jgi:hypothetical protein
MEELQATMPYHFEWTDSGTFQLFARYALGGFNFSTVVHMITPFREHCGMCPPHHQLSWRSRTCL